MATATANPPSYEAYTAAIQGRPLPLAYIDLDLLDANAEALCQRAGPYPLRLATKSIRCVPILRYLLKKFPGFRGLMAYSAAEAALLAEAGFNDILIAYPTMESRDIKACLPAIQTGKRILFMVDHPDQLKLLQKHAEAGVTTISVCVDLDLSTHFPLLHFGVFRSPLRQPGDLKPLVDTLRQSHLLQLEGLMGYEGQIAGLPDKVPGSRIYNLFVRFLKKISQRECFSRRVKTVAYLRKNGFRLSLVNGGGTGSVDVTRRDPSVTEITVGSGLYSPTLFDHFRDFKYAPAAGFVLPVVRQARPHIYACSGGGYIASGPIDVDKQPQVFMPDGLSLFKMLGAGEVQTSVRSKHELQLGQPIFFRHAKAGELFERFPEVLLLRGGKVEQVVKTYRGEGWNFF
ncbi:MAG TPA: alanine racemase [Oligoflexus sp.]|uniref:alanine racemase n=1 Tax=Oligoflexus sp. TaxID=1971216 RepID=UPI002D5AA561|nr:alanine racemase [Oligoflexus sp.]HYX37000.1 alanine racemase [Oligoflexus sp.]